MDVKMIGVIGAGIMGTDLALDLACHNYKVVLKDLTEELLAKAPTRIEQQYKLVKMMKKESMHISIDDILSRISFVTDYDEFHNVRIVIENVTERFKVKEQVYAEIENSR